MSQSSIKNLWGIVQRRSTGTVSRRRVDPTGEKTFIKEQVKKELGETIPKHKLQVEIDFKVSPHILRHTYITELVTGGVDLKTVQYLAGHEKANITIDVYTQLMQNQPSDTMPKILKVFGPKESQSEG